MAVVPFINSTIENLIFFFVCKTVKYSPPYNKEMLKWQKHENKNWNNLIFSDIDILY